jgi:DNA-directed RNA polymerase subunit RPC12/RpoP
MINEALRCPNCGRFGFIESTEDEDLDELAGAICHYCGHFLDHEAILECLAQTAAEREKRARGG